VNTYEGKQAWCNLEVKLCDPYLSTLRGLIVLQRHYINTLSFPFIECLTQTAHIPIRNLYLIIFILLIRKLHLFLPWDRLGGCFGTLHGHHLSGKPGNVRDFDSCQGKVAKNCLSSVAYLHTYGYLVAFS